MYAVTTIPDEVLDRVRDGARSALIEPAVSLRALAEQHPKLACFTYTDELLARASRAVCLLHTIGWSTEGEVIPEATVDIQEQGPALRDALSEAMRIATLELRHATPSARPLVRRAVLPLSAFAATVEAASFERAGSDPDIHMFRKDRQLLVDELERDERPGSRPDGCGCERSRRPGGRRGVQECCSDQSR